MTLTEQIAALRLVADALIADSLYRDEAVVREAADTLSELAALGPRIAERIEKIENDAVDHVETESLLRDLLALIQGET